MKTISHTLVLFMFLNQIGLSQDIGFTPYFNHGEPWQFQNFRPSEQKKYQDSILKENNIETQKVFKFDKKGNRMLYSISTFDSNHNEFSIWKLNSKRTSSESQLVSNSHRVYQWKSWGSPKKQYNSYKTVGDEKKLEDKIVLKKNKLKSRTHYYWNDSGILDSLHFYKRNNLRPSNRTHYLYNNESKMIESRVYNKGKLKTIRKYDCQPIGKIEKKVETTTSCVNTEMDSEGNIIKVSEFTNDKGKKRIFKTTYHGNTDRVWLQEGFNYKGKPTYYNETTDTSKIYKSFNRKGKVRWESNTKSQNGKTISKSEFRKGKMVSQTLYTYNSKGLVATEKSYINDKEVSNKTYEYNTLGLITKLTFAKKRKTSVTEREYK